MTLESKQRRPESHKPTMHALEGINLHSSLISFKYINPVFLFDLDYLWMFNTLGNKCSKGFLSNI